MGEVQNPSITYKRMIKGKCNMNEFTSGLVDV